MDQSTKAGAANALIQSLEADGLTITAEVVPPVSASPSDLTERLLGWRGLVDAVNVTDGPMAKVHMSAVASAAILKQNGIEPILQIVCRDRNRIAIMSDLLGAAALGIQNLLALSGDGVEAGDYSNATPVFDAGSMDVIQWAVAMTDEGLLPQGVAKEEGGAPPPRGQIKTAPHFFVGAADIPVVPTNEWSPKSLIAKLDAGAGFVQTQLCYDIDIARAYLKGLAEHGVHERAGVLIGTGPLASAKQARFIDANIFGVTVPAAIIERLEAADDPKAEGRAICVEFLHQLADTEAAGAHIMAPGNAAAIQPTVEAFRAAT